MVKKIIHTFILCSLILLMTNCQKAPINGDLDGRWQIIEIEHNGEIKEVKDNQLYYNFYLHVCNLSTYGGVITEANFTYEGNKINLSFPYINTETGLKQLNKYGIYSNPVEFEVVYLDKKKLIMQNDESLIICRKF